MSTQKTERITTDSVKIYFRIMPETLYFFPGANVTETKDGIAVEFIRCSIHDKCAVSYPATADGNEDFILIKHDSKPVYLKWENTKTVIFPKSDK